MKALFLEESRFFTSQDGLKLHYLDFAPVHDAGVLPAVCIPGLSRSADDFTRLATALSRGSSTPRRVIAIDYRGRGLSEWASDWQQYNMATEREDFLAILAELGIGRAHFIGTSRGGLHMLALAATQRPMIATAVLNDIGPRLEAEGLRRIKGYIGQPVSPRTFEEAIAVLKIGSGQHFDGLTPDEWRIFAETTFGADESKLGLRYDPQLRRTLDALDLSKPLPESWDLLDKLHGAPLLTIRGSNSDLLSEATLAEMGGRWPESETITVPGQGHAPLLLDAATISKIDQFLMQADGR